MSKIPGAFLIVFSFVCGQATFFIYIFHRTLYALKHAVNLKIRVLWCSAPDFLYSVTVLVGPYQFFVSFSVQISLFCTNPIGLFDVDKFLHIAILRQCSNGIKICLCKKVCYGYSRSYCFLFPTTNAFKEGVIS